MKLSTAKRFVEGYKASVRKRHGFYDRTLLIQALNEFEANLKHNRLIGKY